jgi:ADP-heptose:LPS heptosyltransferase
LGNTWAQALFERIQRGDPWTPALIDGAIADPGLFRDLVEPLADAFDPRLADAYVRVFAEIIARVYPHFQASELVARHERVRQPRRFQAPDPATVFVLSRVTLGADAAITSVVLDAALQRFPGSKVFFAGPRQCGEMFASNPRVRLLITPYHRGATLREKLALSRALESRCSANESIVIDADSRLTQLGLMPICEEDCYYFFDSRSETRPGSLSQLTARWAADTFGVAAKPWVGDAASWAGFADVTVSLGVGGNPEKRLPDPFERKLLEMLAAAGRSILVDKGAGGEEAERVDRAVAGLPNITTFQGDFALFARSIARSWLYVGYDSAGQHVAAAAGTPRIISVFAGYPNERFVERWHPTGSGRIDVIRAKGRDPEWVLDEVRRALSSF